MTHSRECCNEQFPDGAEVLDASRLLRRVPPTWIIFDDNLGRWRPTSAAFEDDRDGDPMSVYRRDIIEAEGGSILRVLAGHDGYWLASLIAAELPPGTPITIRMQSAISSIASHSGDGFDAVLDKPILFQGQTIAPAGCHARHTCRFRMECRRAQSNQCGSGEQQQVSVTD